MCLNFDLTRSIRLITRRSVRPSLPEISSRRTYTERYRTICGYESIYGRLRRQGSSWSFGLGIWVSLAKGICVVGGIFFRFVSSWRMWMRMSTFSELPDERVVTVPVIISLNPASTEGHIRISEPALFRVQAFPVQVTQCRPAFHRIQLFMLFHLLQFHLSGRRIGRRQEAQVLMCISRTWRGKTHRY